MMRAPQAAIARAPMRCIETVNAGAALAPLQPAPPADPSLAAIDLVITELPHAPIIGSCAALVVLAIAASIAAIAAPATSHRQREIAAAPAPKIFTTERIASAEAFPLGVGLPGRQPSKAKR